MAEARDVLLRGELGDQPQREFLAVVLIVALPASVAAGANISSR